MQMHDAGTHQRMWLLSFILWLACPQDGHARERLRPPMSPQNAFRACACALHHHDALLTCPENCTEVARRAICVYKTCCRSA